MRVLRDEARAALLMTTTPTNGDRALTLIQYTTACTAPSTKYDAASYHVRISSPMARMPSVADAGPPSVVP